MHLDFLLQGFRARGDADAITWRGHSVSYAALLDSVERSKDELHRSSIRPGSVVSLTGDFSPVSIALLLAMADRACIIAPILASASDVHREYVCDTAEVEFA